MREFKILFTFFISFLYVSNAYSANIENIQAVDSETIKMIASSDVTFSDIKVYWEVKILKDITILNTTKDTLNKRKLILNLDSELSFNSAYSLISVIWAEWSIEFEIGESYLWEKINPNYYNETKIIEKVVVIDSKTIEVYYNYDLTSSIYEFKLLSELKVSSIESQWNNVLDVRLETPIKKSSSYIFMIISLENIDWEELVFNNSLFDFTTNSNLIELGQISQQELIVEPIIENNVEDIALNAAATPDSWAGTWFVMLLTFIVSTFYFTRNRFKKI
jgi:hypothetical protein